MRVSLDARSKIPPHVNQAIFNIFKLLLCFIIHGETFLCISIKAANMVESVSFSLILSQKMSSLFQLK